jgi:phage terminase large subunit
MKVNVNIDNDLYNDAYLPYLDNQNDILIFYGGSASGKSVFQAQRIITNILKGDRNYLCLRKVGNTIRDSIFPELRNVIDSWNLEQLFDINKTEKEITCKNGYKIICRGLDDSQKLKSIRTQKGVITDTWLEEATEMNEDDFSQIEHRLRGESKYKKQITMTFNPISQLHWIKNRFFDLAKEDIKILKTTFLDNKFLKQEDIDRIEKYKEIDKYYYDVYALGNWGVLGNLVFNNWVVEDLSEIKDSFNTYYYGLDFGYTNDPTAIIKVALKEDRVYIFDEIYQKGLQNNEIAKLLKGFCNGYVYCDCSEPKSIKELRDYGINALPVTKGKDSVKHGIQWLKQKKILVDKNCRYTINELQTYKYREDKDGNVLNEPVDMNNHILDSLRYSLESMMRMNVIKSSFSANSLGL